MTAYDNNIVTKVAPILQIYRSKAAWRGEEWIDRFATHDTSTRAHARFGFRP